MNHQGLLWNGHCVATVVLRKQLNFKSAAIRSNRSSCCHWTSLWSFFNLFAGLWKAVLYGLDSKWFFFCLHHHCRWKSFLPVANSPKTWTKLHFFSFKLILWLVENSQVVFRLKLSNSSSQFSCRYVKVLAEWRKKR